MDNLKLPAGLQAYLQNKCQFYETMRRHELEVKNYMQSKIISLKEDIIQGQHKSATQRMLAIQASVTSNQNEWGVRILGKVQGEPESKFLPLFERVRISFEGTGVYQPIEWVKHK
jgi:hypothetical protein